jgi:outer membrane protein OmpA-like peptidoglycan-associated protein
MKRSVFCLGLAGIALAACVPPPPPPVAAAQVYEVFFDLGATGLNERGRTTVENAAAAAGRRPVSAPVEVIGHADAIGGAQANAAISQARAQTVAAALAREGVARERIILRAAGDNLPVVPTGRDEREPRNRRVEIIIR